MVPDTVFAPPSTVTATLATPTLSDDVPVMVGDVLEMVEPLAGLDMETVGSVVSCTVTVNDFAEVLPAASLAVHVTVVAPIGNVEPEAGVHVGPLVTPTLSVAVTVNVTRAPEALVACTVIGDGTVIVGGVVSTTLTVLITSAAGLPAESETL